MKSPSTKALRVNPLQRSLAPYYKFAWTGLYTSLQLLNVLISRNSSQDKVRITQAWSQKILQKMSFEIEVTGAPILNSAGFLVGNHISFWDIPLLFSQANVCFLSKKEISDWPVIGKGAREIGTLFVDRSSLQSRKESLLRMAQKIQQEQKTVALFPEGTSSITGGKWKFGAFKLAFEKKLPVQAFCLHYEPLRDCAYILEDTLWGQFKKCSRLPLIKASLEFSEPCIIQNVQEDCLRLQQWVQERFNKKL